MESTVTQSRERSATHSASEGNVVSSQKSVLGAHSDCVASVRRRSVKKSIIGVRSVRTRAIDLLEFATSQDANQLLRATEQGKSEGLGQ